MTNTHTRLPQWLPWMLLMCALGYIANDMLNPRQTSPQPSVDDDEDTQLSQPQLQGSSDEVDKTPKVQYAQGIIQDTEGRPIEHALIWYAALNPESMQESSPSDKAKQGKEEALPFENRLWGQGHLGVMLGGIPRIPSTPVNVPAQHEGTHASKQLINDLDGVMLSDAIGRFKLSFARDDSVYIYISHPDYLSLRLGPFEPSATDMTRQLGTVILKAAAWKQDEGELDTADEHLLDTGSIQGFVVNRYGAEVSDAEVSATVWDDAVLTDTKGAFSIRKLEAGQYTLVARHAEHGESSVSVQITVSKTLSNIRIQLPR